NRLIGFKGNVTKGAQSLQSSGGYKYDSAHRFAERSLSITGTPGATFLRTWKYAYDPLQGPAHAPSAIGFAIGERAPRNAIFTYDDIGRMTRIGAGPTAATEASVGVLSNRALTWDAEGRLIRVRGVTDLAVPGNEDFLREDYVYDSGGNRA